MNSHAKRTVQTLEALGFDLDEDASTKGVRVYSHANDPTAKVKVFAGLSEIAAKKIRNRADQIIGLASAGERIPESLREHARIRQAADKAKRETLTRRENAERAKFQDAADRDAATREHEKLVEQREREVRNLRNLMMPGGR